MMKERLNEERTQLIKYYRFKGRKKNLQNSFNDYVVDVNLLIH